MAKKLSSVPLILAAIVFSKGLTDINKPDVRSVMPRRPNASRFPPNRLANRKKWTSEQMAAAIEAYTYGASLFMNQTARDPAVR